MSSPSPTPSSKYIYSPLNPTTQEIRLITLQSNASLTAPVILTLSTESLYNKPSYEATSYVWGDPAITAPITLDGVSVDVTTNLETALRYFRLESEERVLWADAICINQQDNKEKSVQVGFMGEIYLSCTRCLAWLGEDLEGDGKTAFTMLKGIVAGDAWPFNECAGTARHYESQLQSLSRMMNRPYWSRLWVVQETVLPLDVEYWCGSSMINRVDWTESGHMDWSAHIRAGGLCDTCTRGLYSLRFDPVRSFRKGVNNSATEADLASDSIKIVQHMSELKCQNPLDIVYALRHMMTSEFRSGIPIDYENTSLNQLSAQVLEADIRETGKLRALGMKQLDESELALSEPSWWPVLYKDVPTTFEIEGMPRGRGSFEFVNFRASGLSQPIAEFNMMEGGMMGIASVMIARVEASESLHSKDMGLGAARAAKLLWEELNPDADYTRLAADKKWPTGAEIDLSTPYIGGGTIRNAWWRTMVSDVIINENLEARRAKPEDETPFWAFIKMVSGTTKASWDWEAFLMGGRSETDYSMLFSWGIACWRHSFITTDQGYIGTGPLATLTGDEVHIVAGCNWPLLLRRVTEKTGSSPGTYRCLGRCYIHGVMDGEVAENLEDRLSKIYLV
ncbi:hypothetical protein ONS96_001652 [Cadophora gregata f. sp. sojae]|nr:hypothetical protein ONS96_001652 [Cadophora gregata f. sp. sojae]